MKIWKSIIRNLKNGEISAVSMAAAISVNPAAELRKV
jgi:hypothetical protein